jgi:hypothetical protein
MGNRELMRGELHVVIKFVRELMNKNGALNSTAINFFFMLAL